MTVTKKLENGEKKESNGTPQENTVKILTEKEMSKNWEKLDHHECCLYQKFSVEFLKKHEKTIDWKALTINPNLTIEILDAFPKKIDWISLCVNEKHLADTIIYNYRRNIYWQLLLPHRIMDMKLLVFLSEFYKKSRVKNMPMFWKSVSRYAKFDIDYVDEYHRKLDFKEMSYNPFLDNETIDKYYDKFDPKVLLRMRSLQPKILLKHEEYFRPYLN